MGPSTATTGTLTTYVPRLLLGERGRAGSTHWEVEGSLVFADISGFTRLTEKLARQGKAGAEEMVTTLSRVFTALLGATHDGGDVLKFGGDALLILYTGDDHALRACHAAQGMRRTLREVGAIDSSQGRVRLRMSVGVHSGSLPMFLVGRRDALELLVLGSAATTTVAMESAADPGEILVSPATASMLEPGWLGPTKAGGCLLRRVPAQPPVVLVPPVVPDAEVEVFVPRLLRGRLGDDLEHEHRRVAVAFVHFGGVDALLDERGRDEVFDRVDGLTRLVQTVCDELEVLITCTDIGDDGGKFMLAAGAPDASEDDGGRLLRALHRIVSTDVGLPLRAGANLGHVFAGAVGASFRRTYSTMGDATNLAARLMGKAPVGRVLASRELVDRAAGRFQVETVPPFAVKGKARPVEALLVGAPTVPAAVDDEFAVPTVARRDELRALRAAVDELRRGHGVVVELVGELGSGRTRLLADLSAAEPDLPWVRAVGDAYATTQPYGVVRPLLRRLLGLEGSRDPTTMGAELTALVRGEAPQLVPWLPLLAAPLGAEVSSTPEVERTAERFRRQRLHTAVAELLGALCDTVGIVVDDADHMDEASAALLDHVARTAAHAIPWLLVLVRRPTTPRQVLGDSEVRTIEVGPLSRHDAATLVMLASERHPLPPHAPRRIVEHAGGNPLFLLESVRAAAGAGSDADLPVSIESFLAARVDALDTADRRALRELAVLGDHAPGWLVSAVLGDTAHRVGRATWEGLAGFVDRTRDGLSFRHGLVRQVAYEGLTYHRRRELHARAADALLAHPGSDQDWSLSWHLAQAERWPETWAAAVVAGDQARAAYANAEASEFYRRALIAARRLDDLSPDDLVVVAERCGDVSELAALYDQAADAYTTARRSCRCLTDRLRLVRKQGVVDERVGRYSSALRWYSRGLRLAAEATEDTDAGTAQLLTAYAGVLYRQGRFAESVRRATAAADAAERAGDRRTLAHAYYLLDGAFTDLGDHERAVCYRDLALPIFEALGDLIGQANVLNNLGVTAFFDDDLDTALEMFRRARAAYHAAGDVSGAALADNNIAEILVERGELDEAERLFRAARRVWRGAGYSAGIALTTSNLGMVAAGRGDHEEALTRYREALAQFRGLGAGAYVVETLSRVAATLGDLERWVEAWEAAGEVLAAAPDGPLRRGALRVRAEALQATGSAERAAALWAEIGETPPPTAPVESIRAAG